MQSRVPSSLYSILRVPRCAQWTHYDQKPACQTERKTLWSRASYANLSVTTKSGSLASRTATAHLAISSVGRKFARRESQNKDLSPCDVTEFCCSRLARKRKNAKWRLSWTWCASTSCHLWANRPPHGCKFHSRKLSTRGLSSLCAVK